jgi:hypothetical protein
MPSEKARARARKDKREGKSASTQAGEFVREEIEHMREDGHAEGSVRQAIAIGLSEARRAGIDVPARRAAASKKGTRKKPAAKKAAAKGTTTASARRARKAASARTTPERSASAKEAAPAKGPAGRKLAAKKASRTKGATGRSAGATRAARTRAMHERER